MAAQNVAIRYNHIKARIDKTQQNSKYRPCGERDKTINHIISGCGKLAQKNMYTYTTMCGNIVNNNVRTLMNETNTLLYEKDIPLTLYSRKGLRKG